MTESIVLRLGFLDTDNRFYPPGASSIPIAYTETYLSVLRLVFPSVEDLPELKQHDTHVGRDFASRLHPTDSVQSLTVVRFECPGLWAQDESRPLHKKYDLYVIAKQIRDHATAEVDLVVVIDNVAISLFEYLTYEGRERGYVVHIGELAADLRRKAREFIVERVDEIRGHIDPV